MLEIFSPPQTRQYINSTVSNQTLYNALKYDYRASAFVGRIFVIYEAQGKGNPPRILNRLKVLKFECNEEFGSDTFILNTEAQDRLWFGHTPEQIWDYPIFLSVPIENRLHWQSSRNEEGVIKQTLLFGVEFRTKDHPSNCTPGAIYGLSPNRFHELYSNVYVNLR